MPESDEALAELRCLAIKRICGDQVGSDQLIDAGLRALLTGVDSPSLRLLAGLGRREEPEAPDLFMQVLDELGLDVPDLPADHHQALWVMARWWADLIVGGNLDPLDGADLIWWRVASELGYPEQLRAIVEGAIAGADWDENWTVSLEQIKSDIVRAAHEFLAGPGSTQSNDRSQSPT
ncbi:hypothetical protein OHB12_33245 [Nocardia sp. NBC_01730]|uniref:hypothetical protein n=1 Tax=Nocardia sp. NBC_01730 TaxID=2975998 RepID=UPI002E1675EA|nr:hypothetical protein OHB12_33245 [Nocardia sp. NBC_01730]